MYLSNVLLLLFICFTSKASHYDEKYWAWQSKIGKAGAKINKFMFEGFVKNSDIVLDFGCGGGYFLNELKCKKKFGIECNQCAIDQAKKMGIEAYSDLSNIENESVDVVFSHHALEHVVDPYSVLIELKKKLKKEGILIIIVPSEQSTDEAYQYAEGDGNQHLFTWTPMTLGNLVTTAGYTVISSKSIQHCWVGNFVNEAKKEDLTNYHKRCRAEAIRKNNYQVHLVAQK